MQKRIALLEMTIAMYSAVLAVGNILLGMLVFIGGQPRMSSVSFTYVIQIAPAQVWGLILLAAGFTTLVGQRLRRKWPVRAGHSISGTVCLTWVIAFVVGAWNSPVSPWTGIGAYSIIGVLHAMAAGLTPTWESRGRR